MTIPLHRSFFVIILQMLILTSTFSYYINGMAQPKPIVCQERYALCTSAACIPDPRHPEYAICACVVEDGENAGYKTCADRAPKQRQFNTTQVISTFSFKQFNTKKSMNCKKGEPWSNCVDAPCIIDPTNPHKAICSCKINHTEAFFTFGGNCDIKTCGMGFWSGATLPSGILLRNALLEKLKITKNPWPHNTCQK